MNEGDVTDVGCGNVFEYPLTLQHKATTIDKTDWKLQQLLGHAHLRRFEQDGAHSHLKKAQKALTRSLKYSPSNIETLVHLPHALIELANL